MEKSIEIKLTNIKYYERMSEETNCFDAYIVINGIKAAYAKNDGRGGETYVHAILFRHNDAETKRNIELLNEAQDYCKSLPPEIFEYGDKKHEIPSNIVK